MMSVQALCGLVSADQPVRERIDGIDIWVTDADKDGLPRVLFVGDSITQGWKDRCLLRIFTFLLFVCIEFPEGPGDVDQRFKRQSILTHGIPSVLAACMSQFQGLRSTRAAGATALNRTRQTCRTYHQRFDAAMRLNEQLAGECPCYNFRVGASVPCVSCGQGPSANSLAQGAMSIIRPVPIMERSSETSPVA